MDQQAVIQTTRKVATFY